MVCAAQTAPKVALETNESLFTVLTAINTCGYDSELSISDPLRTQIRSEAAKAGVTDDARDVSEHMCQFYKEHQQEDPARTLAQYVSLALFLGPPPEMNLKVKDTDLAPDANSVAGILPMLQRFYEANAIHQIWQAHEQELAALSNRYHEPLAKMTFDTEIYLKIPSSGYLGRTFTVYLDPMGAPGETNSRNYGSDYFVVLSPGVNSSLKMEQIRHAYLHYLLDPMAMKYPANMERLKPILENVKTAPMDKSFKNDISLLVTECLIRAVEVRTSTPGKNAEAERESLVSQANAQGFVLTPYFYEYLAQFEKSPVGLKNAYIDMISGIDVMKEEKRLQGMQFASVADPEPLHLSTPTPGKLLQTAEEKLSTGDPDGAAKLAQQAIDQKSEDQGRALFILAQVATMKRDIKGAQDYFQKALNVAQEPKVVAWSHIYLGRIFDLQEEREQAVNEYRAALTASGDLPEAKAAAEKGIAKPYEPPHAQQQ
jgi:hypothetical protein